MKRRSFLTALSGAAGAGTLAVRRVLSGQKTVAEQVPRRALGRTGEKLSVVGFPGLALIHHDQQESTEGLHEAFDRGVNYFDVAPAYGKGDCEIKMGIGLQGLNRDDYFLACKTKMRDKEGAREELERSLQRLKTDHFDLYQLHCLKTPEEVQKALGPGGAMETILKAKEEGKIRHIGFSAHTTKGALAAMNAFRFDTVMFPISFVEYYLLGFGKPILELAAEQGAAVLAMKALCRGAWPKDMERTRKWWYRPVEEQEEVAMAMRFVLSHEAVTAGIPPSFLDILDKAIIGSRDPRPITKDELAELERRAQSCVSIFKREEDRVACADRWDGPAYPDSPHECCSGYA